MWTASREAERKAEDREIDTGSLICIESRIALTTTTTTIPHTTLSLSLSNNVSLYTTLHYFLFFFLLSSYFPARSRRKETFLTIWDYILEQVWNNKVHFPQEEEEKGWLCWWTMWRRNLRYLQKVITQTDKKIYFFYYFEEKTSARLHTI